MTRASLNLIGDEDAEDAIEAAFELRFTADELRSMTTVGAIHDVIVRRLPARGGACETSMTFYRLRRGLTAMETGERTGPSTPLPPFFRTQTKRSLRTFEKVTDLRMPPHELGRPGAAALLIGLGAVVYFLVGLFVGLPAPAITILATVVAAGALVWLDRGRLPKGLDTLGDLARRTAPLNFGRLAGQGARVSDELSWSVLCEALGDIADVPPDEIGRETLIYPPEKAVA
jgi:hypothetical protein